MSYTRFTLLFSVLFYCITLSVSAQDESLPDENTLKNMQIKMANTWAAFEQKAFVPMLEYHFNRDFTTEANRLAVYELTVSYENSLKNISSEQLALKNKIEQYDASDWDLKYGKNGLWRSFDTLINQTGYLIAKCLYYRAQCQSGSDREKTIAALFQHTSSIKDGVNSLYRDMLEAQVYMLDRKSNPRAFDAIFTRLDAVEKQMSADTELYYDMWMCRLNLIEPFSVAQLDRIIDNFKSSKMADSPAIAMKLAFFQLQVKRSDLLEASLNKWPQLAKVTAEMIYKNIEAKFKAADATQYITDLTLFEKELAAFTSIHKSDAELEKLITSFGVGEMYPSRVLYYSAAVSNAADNKKIAVDCAFKALQQPEANSQIFTDVSDIAILTVGAKAGFSLLESDYSEKVLSIFDRYLRLAAEHSDPQLVFSYAAATKKIRPAESKKLLTDIYEAKGAYADKAFFELLIDKFNDGGNIFDDITSLYERADVSDIQFYSDVTDLYCRSLADNKQVAKSLEILTKAYADKLTVVPDCGVYVLRKFLEEAEQIIDEGGQNAIDDAINVGGHIIGDETNTPATRLLYIETAALAGWKADRIGRMPEFSDIYNTLEFSMAKARYEMSAGNFYEAAFVWSRLSRAIGETSPLPLWKWQRAKYYQIYCSLESGKVPLDQILHSITVLQADRNWIAGYWADRLTDITPAAPAAPAEPAI